MLKKISLSSYLLGALSTFVILGVILISIGIYYTNAGVSITIGVSELPSIIREQVVTIVESQLPLYVGELKAEIPYIVDSEMTGKIDNASIRIGDIEYPLPSDSIKAIEDGFKGQVQMAMFKLLEGLDEKIVAENMSLEVENKFIDFLEDSINRKVFMLNPIKMLKVPVTVNLSYDENEAIRVFNMFE